MWTQDNYLESQLEKYYSQPDTLRERDKLSVSDTGCLLHRQLKLWQIPTDRPLNNKEKMVFEFGNQLHTFLQRVIEGDNEFEVQDEYFTGHIDKITTEDGKLVVNEFKSIKDYGMDRIEKDNQPQESHIKQATNYVRMLKDSVTTTNTQVKGQPLVADYFRIIYLAKCFDDSHRRKQLAEERVILRTLEYKIDYDPILADTIVEEAQMVLENVKTRNPLACSEWGTPYHRDGKWNQFLSWCSSTPEKNKERLDKLNDNQS